MMSPHVTRRTCTSVLTLLVYLMGLGKLVDIFLIETNFLTLIDHFSKIYGILMLYLLKYGEIECNRLA